MSNQEYSQRFWRVTFLVTMLFFLLLTTRPLLATRTDVTFANFVATTITSVLLLLGYLYLADIQKNQSQIMEAAYTPVLIVNELIPREVDPDSTDEGDWAELNLSNVGNEVAKDVTLKVVAKTVPTATGFTFHSTANGLNRMDMEVTASQSEGGVLAAENTQIPFSGTVKLDFDADEGSPADPVFFTNAVSAVPESVDRIQFALVLEFSNSAGSSDSVPIRPARVINRPTEPLSFREAWEQGEKLPVERVLED